MFGVFTKKLKGTYIKNNKNRTCCIVQSQHTKPKNFKFMRSGVDSIYRIRVNTEIPPNQGNRDYLLRCHD